MKTILLVGFLSISLGTLESQDKSAGIENKLAAFLKKFPRSDANKDGVLTREEAKTFKKARKGKGTKSRKKTSAPSPTHSNVAYGEHSKQCFDLWLPETKGKTTPLAIFIHGGGFKSGDKEAGFPGTVVEYFNSKGIAFASLNYRLSDVGPYPIMMHDGARAIQTIRHRAAEWNINPEKIGCFGSSAGAGISLWLAFHDDLADPDSEDPIARQSTRLSAVATSNGQSTYDHRTFREWFGVPNLPLHSATLAFYGIESEDEWKSDRVIKVMEDASPITHLTADDKAPVFLTYRAGNRQVDAKTSQDTWVHHVLLGLKLQEAMTKLGLDCAVRSPDHEDSEFELVEEFIAAKLTE